jgi:hypothetical protein
MARKITMFELHFDGAQFGPSSLDTPETTSEVEEVEEYPDDATPETGGRSPRRLVIAAIGVSIGVSLLVRRLARRFDSDDDGITIEEVEETEEPAVR